MKQYIKKVLWIIPFVFSLNLSGATYVCVSGAATPSLTNRTHWIDLATSSSVATNTAWLAELLATGNTFDLNGKTVSFNGAQIGEVTFTDGSGSSTRVQPVLTTILRINSTNPPVFNSISVDWSKFATNGTILYNSSTADQICFSPFEYCNLVFEGNSKIIPSPSPSTGIKINKRFRDSSTAGLTVKIKGLISFESNSSIILKTATKIYVQYDNPITDFRTTKSFPATWYYDNNPNTVKTGTYDNLTILQSAILGGNVTVTGDLDLSNGTTNTLNLSIRQLKIEGTVTGSSVKLKGSYYASIVLNKNNGTFTLPLLSQSGNDNVLSDLTLMNNEIVTISDNIRIFGSLNLGNGRIVVNGKIINFIGDHTTGDLPPNDSYNIAPITKSSSGQIDLSAANSKLIISSETYDDPTPKLIFDLPANVFYTNTVERIMLNFPTAGELVINENVSIVDTLDIGANQFNLNGKNLTLRNKIVSATGGNLIGHASSNLTCSTLNASVGNIYLDQAAASNYTLQALTLANGASCTLGSNLILTNGIDLGTGSLTTGSNTLTFSGTSTQPISRSTGTINPSSGTIKYSQTSINGNNTLIISAYSSNFYNLTLDFANGGTLTPDASTTVTGTLNLSGNSNTYNLNGTTLTVSGNVTSIGGKFKGSSTSNLTCSTATSTIYFDQTSGESGRTIKNLTITNGADVTLGNWLNITGGSSNGLLTVNSSSKCSTNNYLILKADTDGYAQVANSAGSIVGNIHVQTYFPSTAGRGYRFISSQVKDGYFYSLRDSSSAASGGSTYGAGKNRTANVGIQITGSGGSSKGFDGSTTNNPSAFYFNEANAGNYGLGSGTDGGWTAISDASSTGDKLVNGKGYRVLIRGDRTINLTGSASNNIATTTQITGSYPGSSVQTTITKTGSNNNSGINLVGNPYPANLSWTEIKKANTGIGLDAAYAVYDVVNGRYNVYNASAGTGTASDDIAAGQGFLVYTSSSSATFTINESCKNTAAKGDRYFKKQRSNHLVITMSYDTLYSDKSIVYFLPGSSTSYDEFDGGHIQNPYVNLSSLDATNSQYALNCLDTLETERTVPLSVKGTAPGDFSMTFEDCGTFLNNDIYLFDKFLNKKVKIDDWTKYDFSITADPFSAEDGRLSLFFTPKETNKLTIIEKTTSFSISPNPVTDNFVINYKGKNNVNVEYSIVNTGGQEVQKGKIQTNDKVITKDLARGIYFMTVKSQTESQTIKFIK